MLACTDFFFVTVLFALRVALLDVAAWHASTNLSSADAKVLAKRKRLQLTPDCECDDTRDSELQLHRHEQKQSAKLV